MTTEYDSCKIVLGKIDAFLEDEHGAVSEYKESAQEAYAAGHVLVGDVFMSLATDEEKHHKLLKSVKVELERMCG